MRGSQWGVIIDRLYLEKLQSINKHQTTTFCGFGVFTENFENPPIDWNLNDTFIQDKGINQDFGLFDSQIIFIICINRNLARYSVWLLNM